jgi:hypothetical protein
LETPSRRAAFETPPALATSTNVLSPSISNGSVPDFETLCSAIRRYRVITGNDIVHASGATVGAHREPMRNVEKAAEEAAKSQPNG